MHWNWNEFARKLHFRILHWGENENALFSAGGCALPHTSLECPYSSPCSPPFLMTFNFSFFGSGTSFGIFSWIGAGSEGFFGSFGDFFTAGFSVVGLTTLGSPFLGAGVGAGVGFSVSLGVVVVVGFGAGFSVGLGVVVVVGFGAGFSTGLGVVVVGFGVVVVGFGVVVVVVTGFLVVVVVGFGVVVVVVVGFGVVVVVVGFGVVVVVVVVVGFSSSKRALLTRTFGSCTLGSLTRARYRLYGDPRYR